MKKITFLFSILFSIVVFSQTTTTTTFSENITLFQVPDNGGGNWKSITPALLASTNIPAGSGAFFAANTNVTGDFAFLSTGGNTGAYLGRITDNQFGKGVAYVFNNTGNAITGSITLGFDYIFNSSGATENTDRFAYRVWGIQDDAADGIEGEIRLTGGSGGAGDNDSTNYINQTDGTQLAGNLNVADVATWTTISDVVDVTDYEYIVIQIAGALATVDAGNFFGVDNWIVPGTNTLSTKNKLEKSQFAIYPNPATNEVTVKNIQGAFSYNIYNVSGKLLRTAANQVSNAINISDLSAGMYFLELADKNNIKSTTKLIKQ